MNLTKLQFLKQNRWSGIVAFLFNMMLAYVCYFLCEVAFILENWNLYGDSLFSNSLSDLLTGSFLFHTSAIIYTNIIYILMMLIPLHLKERAAWQKAAKWVFVVVNSLAIVMNLADSVYLKYTGRRTTLSVIQEFSNENNIGSVLGTEIVSHWYLVLTGIVMIAALWIFYQIPKKTNTDILTGKLSRYYLWHGAAFIIAVPLIIAGMRGGFTTAVRPITISNANQYVNRPIEAAAILNTPFSIIRTAGKKSFSEPQYFSLSELDGIYNPVHTPVTSADSVTTPSKKNVVILIVESFGREYIGAYNEKLENGHYKGYTPFIDSLYQQSLSFDYTFCNGRKSIDGMPSILSSIPMFMEPFFLTSASLNDVSGVAEELGSIGYETAFFHGAENGSMGFQAFSRTTGFNHYYGRTEYDADKRFGGEADFDGTWAIWDEPFLQFYAQKMTEMKEPFVTAVFTASSHHPFKVPENMQDIYPEEGNNPIHKCIRYTDHALQRFFETARKQPWFENTLFVFTSDHTNLSDHAEYKTDLGGFGSPILFYDPSGEIKAGRRHCIAQQIDIMPTVLSYLHYNKPYVAFGKDLLTTADNDTWAVNYNNGIYQYVKGDYLLQFDGEKTKAVYNIKKDWLLKQNIKGKTTAEKDMERQLKAIIQQYMHRMNNNQLTTGK